MDVSVIIIIFLCFVIFKLLKKDEKKHPLSYESLWNRVPGMDVKECLENDLLIYSKETDESSVRALDKIHDIMCSEKLTYEEALKTDEGRAAIFQLLLHRHWLAYHAESLRQITARESNHNILEYTQKIENVVGREAMGYLLDQFIQETTPYFKKRIKEALM